MFNIILNFLVLPKARMEVSTEVFLIPPHEGSFIVFMAKPVQAAARFLRVNLLHPTKKELT